MGEWNLVPREELLITVTGSASVRQIFLAYRRGCIARRLNLMHWPMAGPTVRRVRIACRSRLSVYAFPEFLDFIGMALRTFCRRRLGGGSHLMRIAVAGLASSVAERAMNAARHMGSFFRVASGASNLRHFVGVWKVLDGCVAVVAAQSAVDAGHMLGGINRDAFAAGRRHSRLAVAGEAVFVLLERMRGFRLCSNPSG